MTTEGSTRAGIQEGKLSSNSHLSWTLTQMLSPLKIALYELVILVWLHFFIYLVSFLLFLLLFSFIISCFELF